jgi:hypothetical protein
VTLDHLTDAQCSDLAELAVMLRTFQDDRERREIRRIMHEVIHPESLGSLQRHKPKRKRRREE